VQAGNPREAQPSAPQAASTHPPPIPSPGPSRTPSVSSRRDSSQRHTRSTSQYEGEKPLRNSGVVTSERSERSERARSQTLQNSPPQETHLQQYSSGGTDSSQRHRTKSMNAPQRQRSHSSGPRPKTASASASASQAVSASSPEGRPRFPSSLQSLLTNEFRYVVRHYPVSHYNYGVTDSLSTGSEFLLWERCVLSDKTLYPADACFVAARIWQVLTHQCRFQCGHVGTYLIFIAFLPHQLRLLAKFQGGTKKCVRENCRVSSTRQPLPCSS
jgi:hypothetical protein